MRWVRVWTTPRQTQDVKSGTYCCYVRRVTLIVRVERMHQPKKLAQFITIHTAQFGLQDKGRVIKWLVDCWMLLNLISLDVRVSHHITSG